MWQPCFFTVSKQTYIFNYNIPQDIWWKVCFVATLDLECDLRIMGPLFSFSPPLFFMVRKFGKRSVVLNRIRRGGELKGWTRDLMAEGGEKGVLVKQGEVGLNSPMNSSEKGLRKETRKCEFGESQRNFPDKRVILLTFFSFWTHYTFPLNPKTVPPSCVNQTFSLPLKKKAWCWF